VDGHLPRAGRAGGAAPASRTHRAGSAGPRRWR
jgi:hypothetical protein